MSLEYGYNNLIPSAWSTTSQYGNVITPTEDIYVVGMRVYDLIPGTANLKIGTEAEVIASINNISLPDTAWSEAFLFESPITLLSGVNYIIQCERTDGLDGFFAYTQYSDSVQINPKIINNGNARYGTFPGTAESNVWVGVDIVIENEPPVPPTPTTGFDVELMNNTEELNKITKAPTLVRTLHGYLRDTTDLVDPEIMIEFDGVLVDCNYMHIPIFNRYYFITKIESVRSKLWKVYAHCDVLKTYAEGILGTTAVVARSENRYNLFLNDSMYKATSDPRLQIANFPNKFTGESYVLIMNGAQYSQS